MKKTGLIMFVILLAAAILRLVDLEGNPPGLEHDEVANWLIDRNILAGDHGIYFTQAYGHEAGYHYIQAAIVKLVGDYSLSLRLASAFMGLLVVAVTFILVKRLYNERVALVSSALVAILFWPVFFSRIGIRAMMTPVFSGLAGYFYCRGLGIGNDTNLEGKATHNNTLLWMALAGLMAGLSMYTYMAARAVPIFFLLFSCWYLLKRRDKETIRGLAVFFFVMISIGLPLVLWLASHPGAEFRITEINKPLAALLNGNFKPVLRNAIKLVGFFGWKGDPLVRQNIIGRPVFDPIGAILFYLGIILSLWRWKRIEHVFSLAWLVCSLTPSIVTADAPSSIRCINCLPVFGVFIGIILEEIAKLDRKKLVYSIASLWLLVVAGWTVRDYFFVWPKDPEVEFVWQTALQKAANYLDSEAMSGPVVVAGWTPESMDPPMMELFLHRDDLELRYINPTQSLLLPENGGLFLSPILLPLDPLLVDEHLLKAEEKDLFKLYHLSSLSNDGRTERAVYSDFGISFLGEKLLIDPSGLSALTYWKTDGPISEPLRIFFHVNDLNGATVGQDDGLGSNPKYWQRGDMIVQIHRIKLAAGEYYANTGLYNPVTGDRLDASVNGVTVDSIALGKVLIP